jgi:hypothetical protein
MAQLPRYQRLGVRTRQPGNIDFADTREQARYSQNLSGALDRMSQFAFKEASAAAQTRGQERVRDEGAVETLEAIDKKGGAFSIADQAAYELGSRVAVAEIQNTAEIETMRILGEAERNETPFSVVQAQLLDLTDGYSESLRVIDPTASSVLRENLNGVTAKATEKYSNWYVNLQAQKQKVKNANAAELQYNNIIQSAILPGMDDMSIKFQISQAVDLLGGLGLSEKQIKAFEIKVYNDAIKENSIFRFNSSSVDEQEKTLKRMETVPDPGMTLGETQTFRKSLQGTFNKNSTVRAQKVSNVVSLIDDQSDIATAGGIVSQKMLTEIESQLDAFGPEGDRARSAYARMTFEIDMGKTLSTMLPSELAQEVASLEAGLPGVGEAGRDTDIEVKTYDFAVKMLNAFETEINANPISAAVKRQLTDDNNNLIQIKPINFGKVDENGDPDIDGVVADLSLRYDQAKIVSNAYGTPLTLFTKEETKLFSNGLKSASMNDRLIALGAVVASGEDLALQAFEELAGTADGAFYAAVGASMVAGNKDVATRALEGQANIESFGAPKLTAGTGLPDAKSISIEVLGSVFGETKGAIPAYRAMAENLYAYYANGVEEFDEKIWRQSLNEAAGYNPENQTGGIDVINGANALIPSGKTPLSVTTALTEMDPATFFEASGQTLELAMFEALSGEIEFNLVDASSENPIYEVVKKKSSSSSDYKIVSVGGNNYMFTYKDSGEPIDDVNDVAAVFDLKKLVDITESGEPVYYTQDQVDAFNAAKDTGSAFFPVGLTDKMLAPSVGVLPTNIARLTTAGAGAILSTAEAIAKAGPAVMETFKAAQASGSELDERVSIMEELSEIRNSRIKSGQLKIGSPTDKLLSKTIQKATQTNYLNIDELRKIIEAQRK